MPLSVSYKDSGSQLVNDTEFKHWARCRKRTRVLLFAELSGEDVASTDYFQRSILLLGTRSSGDSDLGIALLFVSGNTSVLECAVVKSSGLGLQGSQKQFQLPPGPVPRYVT